MNKIASKALLLSVICVGPALAQTTTPPPATMPPAAATSATSGNSTMAPATAAVTPTPSSTTPPAVTTSGVSAAPGAPVAGANSFTMVQAQSRLKDHGFTQVSKLTKDNKSIWRGQAMKDGKTVDVAVDYQGNVTTD